MSRNSINKKPIVSAQIAANNNNKVQQQKPQAKTSQNTSIFKSEQNVSNKSNSKSKTIALQSGRKVVIKDGKARYYAANGTELNQKYFEKTEGKVQIMASGRYTVTKNGQTKYYAANGTELKAEYFKNAESGQINTVKTSKQKTQALNTLIRAGNEANKEFKKQLADDGWAGDVADGISVLWGSDNRASKVRVDIDTHNKNMQALKKAASQGDEAFEKKFKEIYGVNYNQKAIDEYNRKPSDANYQKAFGTKQVNLNKRVREYNQSQQTGAEVVKTTGKVAAGIAVGVATGGTGFVALGAAAIGTGLASVTIDETDRMKVKDLVQKGEVNFREGTNHKQILKDAAFDAGAVFIGGTAAKAAKVVVKGTQAANAAGQVTEVLTKGQKAARAGITIGADVAVGAGQEYATTGDVTLEGTLMNAAMSGVGSAVEFGVPQKAWKGIKRAFGSASDAPSVKKFSAPKESLPKALFDADGNILVGGGDGKPKSGGFISRLRQKFSVSKSPTEELNVAKNQRAIDNGLHEAVAQGKISKDIPEIMGRKGSNHSISDSTTGYVVSDRLVQALEMDRQGKTFVTKLKGDIDINMIPQRIENGGVCNVNGKLYVNDNGTVKPIKLSPEKFEELFPVLQCAAMRQEGGTYICAMTSKINGMLETPTGRAKLFTMLEDTGDGILVHLNHSTVFFPGGKSVNMGKFMENAPEGVRMIEQAFLTTNMKKAANTPISNIRDYSAESLTEQVRGKVNMRSFHDVETEIASNGTKKFKTHTTERDSQGRAYGKFKDGAREKLESILKEFVPGEDVLIAHWNAHARTVVNYDPVSQIVTYRDPMHPGVDTQCLFVQFMNKGHDTYGLEVSLEKARKSSVPRQNTQTHNSASASPQLQSEPKPQSQMQTQNTPEKQVSKGGFTPRYTELGTNPAVVAKTAAGTPIMAKVEDSNIIFIKDGNSTPVPIPEKGMTESVHESSTDTYLIIRNNNGNISVVTSETRDLLGKQTTAPKSAKPKPELKIPDGAKFVEMVTMGGKARRRIQMPDGSYRTEYNGRWQKF